MAARQGATGVALYSLVFRPEATGYEKRRKCFWNAILGTDGSPGAGEDLR